MNFTEKLVADVAAQAAEIAELKKTLADLVNPPQPEPEPEPERIDAWRKNIPVFTDADRRAMVAADAEARRAEERKPATMLPEKAWKMDTGETTVAW